MKKVIIIGCPGSGKSTFAKKLGKATGLPLYHLDMLYWNEDKTTVTKDEFLNRLENTMNNPCWIIDGNYAGSMEIRLKECDTVFFLDYPTEVCLKGVEERVGKPRSDMPWVESDIIDEEFISFIKNYNIKNKPEVIKLLEKYSDKKIIIFTSRNEAEEFLKFV